jgi:hypothetical protein
VEVQSPVPVVSTTEKLVEYNPWTTPDIGVMVNVTEVPGRDRSRFDSLEKVQVISLGLQYGGAREVATSSFHL